MLDWSDLAVVFKRGDFFLVKHEMLKFAFKIGDFVKNVNLVHLIPLLCGNTLIINAIYAQGETAQALFDIFTCLCYYDFFSRNKTP